MLNFLKVTLIASAVIVILFFGFYSMEQVSNSYKNLEQAKLDVIRGWIPDCLPQDSYNISEHHSVDTNIVGGEFFCRECKMNSSYLAMGEGNYECGDFFIKIAQGHGIFTNSKLEKDKIIEEQK